MKAIEAILGQTQSPQVGQAATHIFPPSKITDHLLLLFHGAPGTGKSLAAQCLADYARRPLLLITSGMKGDEATSVDCLRTAFKLARRWDCLVLIDHMETVFEERSATDFDRSTVVIGRL